MAETFEILSARFGDELERRNFRPRTVAESGYNLIPLARFLKERHLQTPDAITTEVLGDFQRWLFYQPTQYGGVRSVASQNRVLSTIKSFFKFLHREGYLPHNPAEGLEYAREPRRLPRHVLTPREAKRILDSIDTSHERGYRDRTLMEVFYATGLRRTELLHLTVENVNLEEELLRINDGKGGKDRVVPLTRTACQFLETYLKGIRPAWAEKTGTDRLFISWRGRPLDANTLGVLVTRHAQQAGIKQRVTCHVWRHSCATHLLKNQANLRHVQEILGHRSLATTERYLHLTITDLKEAHRKFHPREASARGRKAR